MSEQSGSGPGRSEPDTLLEFPCTLPIKVVGRQAAGFREDIVALVTDLVPGFSADAVTERPSRQGRFVSLTLSVDLASKAEADVVYGALSGHESVLWVL